MYRLEPPTNLNPQGFYKGYSKYGLHFCWNFRYNLQFLYCIKSQNQINRIMIFFYVNLLLLIVLHGLMIKKNFFILGVHFSLHIPLSSMFMFS